jgi:hypothetical protein
MPSRLWRRMKNSVLDQAGVNPSNADGIHAVPFQSQHPGCLRISTQNEDVGPPALRLHPKTRPHQSPIQAGIYPAELACLHLPADQDFVRLECQC